MIKALLKSIKKCTPRKIYYLIYFRLYFRSLTKKYKEYSVVVMTEGGIGDCCIAISYLNSFKKKTGKKVLLIACRPLQNLIECFRGYDEIKYVSRKFNSCMRYAYPTVLIHKLRWRWREKMNAEGKLIITAPWAAIDSYKTSLDALTLTRDRMYCVDSKCEYQLPNIDLDKYQPVSSIVGNHNILFNPLSVSAKINIDCFKPIIEYFKALGYNLYTNCKDENSICLPDTERLIANIFDLYLTADRFAYIVSIRSGILDFLITKNSRQIALYDHNVDETMYNLDMWGCGKTLQMFYDDPKMMEKIDEYVKKIGDINEF